MAPAVAEQRQAELWTDPGDMTRLDVFHGPGGEALAPRPGASFQFVAKDTTGFSPGWDVKDERGVTWSVKLGVEAQSEVVASRIVWAMGYRQPPTYYVRDWTLVGGPQPGKGEPGRFRPDMQGAKNAGTWSWEKNPFADTQAFRGLLVLMRLINNWDLLDNNNTVYEFDAPRDDATRWYVVRDLGASLGRARTLSFKRAGSRNDPETYERQGFIEQVERDGRVEFDELGRVHRGLFQHLTVGDVRWTCERVSRLTDAQWDDLFRAAGYEPEIARRFIRSIKEKTAQGLALRMPAT